MLHVTKEQVLMAEHQLIGEATEWGSGSELLFQGFVSGVEAMTGKVLEVMSSEENEDTACMD